MVVVVVYFSLFSFLKVVTFKMFLTDDFCHISFELRKLFTDDPYAHAFTLMKTSKGKDAILYSGYYYNHLRDNKNLTHLNNL